MKVPNITDVRNEVNDVALYRKKKKRNKLIRTVVILVLTLVAVFLIWCYADVIFEPLRGIASKVQTTTTDKAGYPVDLPASSEYKFLGLSDSFALVTDTYLYAYSSGGAQNFALQHGYTKPCSVSNSKRILIYDRGGHNFALYNKTSEIYKQSIDDEIIVSAFISDSEQAAIITSGGRYSNIVYVYDGNGKWLYTHRFIDDNIMQAGFSPDNNYIYLTRVRSDKGDIVTELSKYKLGNDGEAIWSYKISDSVPIKLSVTQNAVALFLDNKVLTVNPETGKQMGEMSYHGDIEFIDNVSDKLVFISDDYSSSGCNLMVLNNECKVTAQLKLTSIPDCVYCSDSGIYLLQNRRVFLYDYMLTEIEVQELKDNYSDMVCVGGQVLLLGYSDIISVDMNKKESEEASDISEQSTDSNKSE